MSARRLARKAPAFELGALVIALYWSSFWSIFGLMEALDVHVRNPLGRGLLRTYFRPIWLAQHAAAQISLLISPRLLWYLPILGMLFGCGASVLGWRVALLVVKKVQDMRLGQSPAT